MPKDNSTRKSPSMFSLLGKYKLLIGLLILFTLLSNALALFVPKIIASGIDSYTKGNFQLTPLLTIFALTTIFIFIFTYLQSIVQTYASETAARDLRKELSAKISQQSYAYIQTTTPAKLLTNLTSDVDAVKTFVAQAVASLISSVFLILGAATLLLMTNWRLGLAVLAIVPLIGGTFYFILSKVRKSFKKAQEVIDLLNKVINESILGAALIRVLYSERSEQNKFIAVNTQARDIGLQILGYFSAMIPIITFVASLAPIIILSYGGHLVLDSTMTLGNFAAFNGYVTILIFPIIMIGFMSNVIARSSTSYERISQVLTQPDTAKSGTIPAQLTGSIDVKELTLSFGEKKPLKDISLSIHPGKNTAIIGPTAAGKTQLLYVLSGLVTPDSGQVLYDGNPIESYNKDTFHQQIGIVFQDSSIFNMTIKENVAFNTTVSEKDLQTAIQTAELTDFIDSLPKKLQTIISERGENLSGGQKQRIMLARALALNPKVLLLDDFTARVDTNTEQKILENVKNNYPTLTLISVTQKIAAIKNYDQIILLMEGELIAKGKHKDLLKTSPEYAQLNESQKSTSNYE